MYVYFLTFFAAEAILVPTFFTVAFLADDFLTGGFWAFRTLFSSSRSLSQTAILGTNWLWTLELT
jgi:hypothetical protein